MSESISLPLGPVSYQSMTIYKESDRIIVEYDSNTYKFFNCTMDEVAAFIRIMVIEDK